MKTELELLIIAAKEGWDKISELYDVMSQEFMIKYRESINWDHASHTQTLEEETIETLSDYFHWSAIGSFQRVSHDFIWKNRHSMENWSCVFEGQNITYEFALKLFEDMGPSIFEEVNLDDIIDIDEVRQKLH